MSKLLKQLKQRRTELGFKQGDMLLRAGISRQQYQRLESRGNPRLDTLELIAEGLECQLMLIPKEKLQAVIALLEDKGTYQTGNQQLNGHVVRENPLADDPWNGLLNEGD